MNISVIIPAHQARGHLGRCLQFIAASTYTPYETIVVDDGSDDDTGGVARAAGATVLRLDDGPHGPAVARNRGAGIATGDVLLFLDADVAVHRHTIERVAAILNENTHVVAVFGSYDDKPTAGTFVSRYRNLLHHFVHQHGRREATTFWGGCGAVRRAAFLVLGGFDERFRRPSVEDIEFGGRLRAAGGRIWLCPDILVRHLKQWTFTSVIRSDIFDRAIPWTRLILQHGQLPSDLNTAMRSRASAVAAWTFVCALPLTPLSWSMLGVAALGLLAVGVLNLRLYRLFFGRGGIRFGCTALGMHLLYLLYSSAVFVAIASHGWMRQRRDRRVATPSPRSAG